MIEFADEVRRLFMGSSGQTRPETALDVTFSTRTLIRWARLTVKFQPLSRQGVSPVNHALDRALALRASPESKEFLRELAQRLFPIENANKED
jgi:cobaltochelatase CobS